jgi:hypothetical protein
VIPTIEGLSALCFSRFECYRSDKNCKYDEDEHKEMVSTHQHKSLQAPTDRSRTMITSIEEAEVPTRPETEYVLNKLEWMQERHIWPNGLRYLWTDAFGVVLLVSLYDELGEDRYLQEAQWVVDEVDRVLKRPRGIRIGEEPDRDGQYFHYLAMWLYALAVLGRHVARYREMGIDIVHEVHDAFLVPGRGVIWKMKEDLSGPYPDYGLGALDAFDGYVSYRMLGEGDLSREIDDMRALIDKTAPDLVIMQDLGLGMMLWMTHFFPEEPWARLQKVRCLQILDRMWIDDSYFCREPALARTRFAFTNYGISIGLQSVNEMRKRVDRINRYFESYRSGDEYDQAAITHVMACSSHFPGALI